MKRVSIILAEEQQCNHQPVRKKKKQQNNVQQRNISIAMISIFLIVFVGTCFYVYDISSQIWQH